MKNVSDYYLQRPAKLKFKNQTVENDGLFNSKIRCKRIVLILQRLYLSTIPC